MNTSPSFDFTQASTAALLGIGIEEIRRRKKTLAEGEDWRRDGNRVLFSDAGVKKLRAALSVPEAVAIQTDFAKNAGAEKVPIMRGDVRVLPGSGKVFALPDRRPELRDATVLEVWGIVANKRIVLAHLPGAQDVRQADLVRVQVRDNANFVKGMPMNVRFVQTPDLFEFTGRLPRWRGKY